MKTRNKFAVMALAALMAVVGYAPAAVAADTPVGALPDTFVPTKAFDTDTAKVELGMKFSPITSGTLKGVQFYQNASNSGVTSVSVWSASGTRLAQKSISPTGTVGWRTIPVSVALEAGKNYTVSVFDSNSRYPSVSPYFTAARTVNGLSIPANAGVYRYGSASGFPSETWKSSNYLVDVAFVPTTPTATATPTPTPTPTVAPTVSPAAGDSPSAGELNLPRIPWEGGPAFWSKFSTAKAAGWTNPDFFPISVFFGKPGHAPALKDVGVNVYMGAEHDGATMESITNVGIDVIAQTEWTRAEVGNNQNVVGWHAGDEPDMGYGVEGSNTEENLAAMQKRIDGVRAWADGRFTQVNYGNGILGTWWADGTMDDFMRQVDSASVDKYAYTSPHVQDIIPHSPRWPAGVNPKRAATYGWLADQMQHYQDPTPGYQPNWVFVESARPYLTEAGATTITPAQMEGAEWSAIIHEARGIALFQHNNDPALGNYSLVDIPESRKAPIRAAHAKIQSLAPVLNTQSYVWNFDAGVDTMLKAHSGSAYIFAIPGLQSSTGSKTFTLPDGVTGTSVEVVGENRTIPISGGTFTDTFASEYTHHVYKIQL
jgi:hypothetical protein